MDINLVMNALNQIAALDSKGARSSHPLLFSLSDYLHGTLSSLPDHSVRRQLELARLHAVLYACVKLTSLSFRVINCPDATVSMRRGLLSELTLCLLRNTELNPRERWKLYMGFEGTASANKAIMLSIALSTLRRDAVIDRHALLEALHSSPSVMAGHVLIDTNTPPNRSKSVEAGFRLRIASPQ